MKWFYRKCTDVSLCGLNCALCSMHLGGYCPGCGGGTGNQACAIARCSMQKQIEFCYKGEGIICCYTSSGSCWCKLYFAQATKEVKGELSNGSCYEVTYI